MSNDQCALSIVVVSFNTREETLDCLKSVYRETRDTNFELIVVDNASTDGSAEAIAKLFPDVTLYALTDNLGFGRANNFAVEKANGSLTLLLNPDTIVLDGAIDKLVAFARDHPDRGIWGGRTVFADGSLNPTSCARSMTVWGQFAWAIGLVHMNPNHRLFNYDAYGGWRRDSVREVDTVTGCFLLISRALWVDLGGFDPVFFMYGEEADLCLRARKKGARPTFTPAAQIVHFGGRSETVRSGKIERLLKAKITFARRHCGGIRFVVLRSIFLTLVVVRVIGFGAKSAIKPSPSTSEKLKAWRSVFGRRSQWLAGYS